MLKAVERGDLDKVSRPEDSCEGVRVRAGEEEEDGI